MVLGGSERLYQKQMNKEANVIRADVVVLGAGLSGLAAAEGILIHGEKPVLIEKEGAVGGLCASIRRDKFIFDFGGHRFLPHHKQTADYVRGLFRDNGLVLRTRKSQIYLGGKFLLYPPEAFDILKNLGAMGEPQLRGSGPLQPLAAGFFKRTRSFPQRLAHQQVWAETL